MQGAGRKKRNRKKNKGYLLQSLIRWLLCICLLSVILLIFTNIDKRLNEGRVLATITNRGVETTETQSTETPNEESKTEQEEDKLTICLDAGHGGNDPGSLGENRYEKDDNLLIVLAIKEELEAKDIKVVLTREEDTYVSLKERVAIANEAQADYFLSIHRNTGDGQGVETWTNSNPSEITTAFATNIHKNIVEEGVQRDRGVKTGTEGGGGGYYVVRATSMPSCLVELGFMTNETDNELFDTKAKAYAKVIAQGIIDTYTQFKE